MARHMKEAGDMDDVQRFLDDKPPKSKALQKILEPEQPKVDGVLDLKKIKVADIIEIPMAHSKGVRNKDGTLFLGFEVSIKNKDDSVLSGWMPAADFHQMRRELRAGGKVSLSNVRI